MVRVKLHRFTLAIGLGLVVMLMPGLVPAQTPPAAAASGVTCKDGTTSARSGRGACSGHGGVAKSTASSGSQSAPAAAQLAARPATALAPGRGGQVWVNTLSKVYHCPGDRYYGKTKQGEYMSEAQAKAQGNRPDHGKSCS